MLKIDTDYLRTGIGSPITEDEIAIVLHDINLADKTTTSIQDYDFESKDLFYNNNKILIRHNNNYIGLVNLDEEKIYNL